MQEHMKMAEFRCKVIQEDDGTYSIIMAAQHIDNIEEANALAAWLGESIEKNIGSLGGRVLGHFDHNHDRKQ